MADHGEGPKGFVDAFFDAIENFLKNQWHWILIAGFIYLLWRYNAWKGALAFVGTCILGWMAWKLWTHYVQQDFISGIDYVLLEIIPPRDVERSPKAMELFFTNALYHWSLKGGKEEYWQGAVWFWFSLEIASIDGQVHFYVRTPTRIRSLIETQMYAQFPQAQVKAVEDYTLGVDEITPESAWNGWGCEWKLLKHQAYPLKTYIDFGLDKDPKEEYKVDPISPIIEFFGSLQKGEQAWMQIVMRPSKELYEVPGEGFLGRLFPQKIQWEEEAKHEMERFLSLYTREHPTGGRGGAVAYEVRPPTFLDNTVKAMSAKTGKIGFDVGIRTMYIAKKEIMPPGTRSNGSRDIRLIFRQFARPDCNGLVRYNPTQGDVYGGIGGAFNVGPKTVMLLANRMLNHFRERLFFHEPLRYRLFNNHHLKWPLSMLFHAYLHSQTFVLNVEEIATLWHFPGQILKVPTLERIESRESSPPPNLPT